MSFFKFRDRRLLNSGSNASRQSFGRGFNRDLENANEEDLLFLLKHGSAGERKEAFAIIFETHRVQVAEMIQYKGIYEADAQDIFGEVWKIAVEKLPDFEYRGKPIWRWLSRTTKIQIDAYFRKKKEQNGRCTSMDDAWLDMFAHIENVFEDNVPSSPPIHIQRLIDQTLPKLLETLSQSEKQILVFSYFHQLDSKQIAKKIGIKAGTVRQKKRRALKKLSQLVTEKGV